MKRSKDYKSTHSDTKYRSSSILGVLILVGVTVFFVGVLGSLTLGISFGSLTTPQVTMSTELDVPNDEIKITHIGGDDLTADTTRIVIVNETDGQSISFGPAGTAEEFKVGDSVKIFTTNGIIQGWDLGATTGGFELRSGMTYTIKIVDTDGEVVLYRTSLTSI